MKPGPNRFYISPSCRLQLADHLIISDISLKLDNVIKHYEWELDKITFSDEDRTTLNAIRQALAADHHSPVWSWVFACTGLLLLTLLLLINGYFVFTRYLWTLKSRILKYLVQLLPESVVCLLTPSQPVAVDAAVDA